MEAKVNEGEMTQGAIEIKERVQSPLVAFALRVAIVVCAISFAISWLVDSYVPSVAQLKDKFKVAMTNREVRLRVNGLLSTNPRVSYEMSLVREASNDLPGAIDEMIVAVGLLEKSGASADTLGIYRVRLEKLRALAPVESPRAK